MSLLAGFEIRPLHVVYMLLDLLDLLISTLFGMSFALAVHLTLELWICGGACLDLAKLLTD